MQGSERSSPAWTKPDCSRPEGHDRRGRRPCPEGAGKLIGRLELVIPDRPMMPSSKSRASASRKPAWSATERVRRVLDDCRDYLAAACRPRQSSQSRHDESMCQHYSTNNTKSREYEESIGQGPNPPSEISPGSPECRPRCECLPPHGVTFFDPGDGLGVLVDNGPRRETRAKVLMESGGGDCTRRHIDARLTFCGFAACFSSWVAECWPGRPDLVAIDGKTSRRSHAPCGYQKLFRYSPFR
jgi:hypothetical protein